MAMAAAAPAKAMTEPEETEKFASSPCMVSEIAPGYFGLTEPYLQRALDVARWRKARRIELLERRAQLSGGERDALATALGAHLLEFITARFQPLGARMLSGYWPIKSELDLRPAFTALYQRGVKLALPVVEVRAQPLAFHAWAPGDKMERGFWNIPVPQSKQAVTPEIALAPLVGWDGEGYRLGYGGGYFDRTLAKLSPKPFVIGVGLQSAKLPGIFPQAHDIRLDAIITEAGLQWSST